MGDSDLVFYINYETDCHVGKILEEIDNIKGRCKAEHYSLTHNCRDFAKEFGNCLGIGLELPNYNELIPSDPILALAYFSLILAYLFIQ